MFAISFHKVLHTYIIILINICFIILLNEIKHSCFIIPYRITQEHMFCTRAHEIWVFVTENENNNVICKELTIVYCHDVLERSLKSPACVISGKLCSVALSTYFFSCTFPAKTEISVVFTYLRSFHAFLNEFDLACFLVDKQNNKKKKQNMYKGRGIWSDGTRISAVHHWGCFSEVT